jgi:hypothetical protein
MEDGAHPQTGCAEEATVEAGEEVQTVRDGQPSNDVIWFEMPDNTFILRAPALALTRLTALQSSFTSY